MNIINIFNSITSIEDFHDYLNAKIMYVSTNKFTMILHNKVYRNHVKLYADKNKLNYKEYFDDRYSTTYKITDLYCPKCKKWIKINNVVRKRHCDDCSHIELSCSICNIFLYNTEFKISYTDKQFKFLPNNNMIMLTLNTEIQLI